MHVVNKQFTYKSKYFLNKTCLEINNFGIYMKITRELIQNLNKYIISE